MISDTTTPTTTTNSQTENLDEVLENTKEKNLDLEINSNNNMTNEVLVGTVDDELEFESEITSTAVSQINQSISKPNNINLCNENDAENIDDNSLLVGVDHDESGLYDDVMSGPNISASEFNEFKSSPCRDDESGNSNSQQKAEQQSNSTIGVTLTAGTSSTGNSCFNNNNKPTSQGKTIKIIN